VGPFTIDLITLTHSIPEPNAVVIRSAYGTVLHTGDWKLDPNPLVGEVTDEEALRKLGEEGVLAMVCDSTNVFTEGTSGSEGDLRESLNELVSCDDSGCIAVGCFASNVARLETLARVAESNGRHAALIGRSLRSFYESAMENGYLIDIPKFLTEYDVDRLPREKVLLICTGSQGEPTSALVRIAKQEHRDVNIMAGDTVVISATPIPGNELPVSHTIDNLLRQGAKVLYDRIATVHVHGHASQEELKLVLRLVRPKYFVPVHGEYRHLTAHAQLAWDLDVAKDGISVMEDGDVLELSEDGARLEEHISAGPIFVDGLTTRDIQSPVLGERRSLSKDGVVVVVVTTDKNSGKLVGEPAAVASGFLDESETGNLFEELSVAVAQELSSDGGSNTKKGENGELKAKVKETARSFIAGSVRRAPMIIPVVLEV